MSQHDWHFVAKNPPRTTDDVWKCRKCGGKKLAHLAVPPGPDALIVLMTTHHKMTCDEYTAYQVQES